MIRPALAAAVLALSALAFPAAAQTAAPPAPPPAAAPGQAAPSAAPAPLVLHFAEGSAAVRPEDAAVLDHAARLFRDGNPIVMVVSGAADSVGSPAANLHLSELRARAVIHGLVARGIPVSRLQEVAKGSTEPAVQAAPGRAEAENRRAEISWR